MEKTKLKKNFIESLKPTFLHGRIMIFIGLITAFDAFIRIEGRDYLSFPNNYFLRPIGPLFSLIFPYSWTESNPIFYVLLTIILTLLYWYILSIIIILIMKLIVKNKAKQILVG